MDSLYTIGNAGDSDRPVDVRNGELSLSRAQLACVQLACLREA